MVCFASLPQIKIWKELESKQQKVFFQQRQKEQPVAKIISQVQYKSRREEKLTVTKKFAAKG